MFGLTEKCPGCSACGYVGGYTRPTSRAYALVAIIGAALVVWQLAACTLRVEVEMRSMPSAVVQRDVKPANVITPADAGPPTSLSAIAPDGSEGFQTLESHAFQATNLLWSSEGGVLTQPSIAACDDPSGGNFTCFSDARVTQDALGVRQAYGEYGHYDGCHWRCVWEPVH